MAAEPHQLVEGPALDDAAALEHQDAGGVADGGEPVRDHEGGAAFHHLGERGLHLGLGQRVERARRLVENEDRRILEQRARDREALALAAGEQPAAFAGIGLEAFRIAFDDVERLRALAGRAHLLLGRIGLADAQVLGDRAIEQQHLLEHDADVAAQARQREPANVHAVDLHHARLRIEDAVQQRERRRFAGAGRADQRDGLAGQRGEAQVGDRRPLAVVGERDVLELHQAAQAAGIDRIGPVAHRGLGVEHLEEFREAGRLHHHVLAKWTACSSLPISRVAKLMNMTISPTVVWPWR